MRRTIAFGIAIGLAMCLSACAQAPQELDASGNAISHYEQDEVVSVAVEGWPENELTDGVPTPTFGTGPTSVTTSSSNLIESVLATWQEVPEEQFDEYVRQVEVAGFSYREQALDEEGGRFFSADDRDAAESFGECRTVSVSRKVDGSLFVQVTYHQPLT